MRGLEAIFQKDLIELHCNLHPLDSFGSQTRKELKELDVTLGLPNTGRDCAVANFLYGLSKLRIKQTGDPAGFTAFLKKNGISPSEIPRYVGNRWNILFQMSSTVIKHLPLLQEYLERFCKNDTSLRTNLLWGITNPQLVTQLRSLALASEVITTPWMKLFYSNPDGLSNLQMVPNLQTFARNIQQLSDDPQLFLTTGTDVFGHPVRTHVPALQVAEEADLMVRCLQLIARAILKVTENQLSRYTTGTLSEVTPDLLEATKSASPHNVWAERVLGMLNALWIRGKQATVSHVGTKVAMVTNDVMKWLDHHSNEEQEKIICLGVRKGAVLRGEEIAGRKDLHKEACKRLIQTSQKRDKAFRNRLEGEIKEVLFSENVEGLSECESFQYLSDFEKDMLRSIVLKKSLKGVKFYHDWDNEDGTTETWNSLVLSQSTRKKTGLVSYKIRYSLQDSEDEATTSTLMAEQFICDVLLGDLKFTG